MTGRRLDADDLAPPNLLDSLARDADDAAPTRRGGWPGPRKTAWAFKPDQPAADAVKRYMEAHGLKRDQRGDLTKALNAMLATHPEARTAKPDTEETPS